MDAVREDMEEDDSPWQPLKREQSIEDSFHLFSHNSHATFLIYFISFIVIATFFFLDVEPEETN